ncbi:acetyltransferase GNAT family protein [Asticcacaulis biprosthecium C19]|uniref:Acetyltransferase GNAT family protein n=1 Tax=Asticcacaulis biprosthecium C19 TaxID=715226 RepID=F4QMI2_9CAUL|nr:helix-turn-helix domain-containing GNAT family N-acetyltransferase [Asticcacaulis biprosthecium]EGF91423.1 acetyltransferase GNAT family protein [Asticcacaulis biprosthecium C19]
MLNQIDQVRRFNRIVSQRAGTLDQSYLGQGRPLGEARLLFEVGHDGGNARELRDRLGLDSGYLSRLLRALESQGMIVVTPSQADRRVRDIRLTQAGTAQVETYDRLSDDLASSILAPLDERQKAKLVEAMAQVERLYRAAAVTVSAESPATADARACVDLYIRELNQRFDTGYDPDTAGPLDDSEFLPPDGVFVVARLDGKAIGCGGLKRLDFQTGEIKRLWVSPEARGLGLGRRLLNELEALARQRGMAKVCLDTSGTLTEAQALYHAQGYVEVAPYNDNPYAQHWFEKRL